MRHENDQQSWTDRWSRSSNPPCHQSNVHLSSTALLGWCLRFNMDIALSVCLFTDQHHSLIPALIPPTIAHLSLPFTCHYSSFLVSYSLPFTSAAVSPFHLSPLWLLSLYCVTFLIECTCIIPMTLYKGHSISKWGPTTQSSLLPYTSCCIRATVSV